LAELNSDHEREIVMDKLEVGEPLYWVARPRAFHINMNHIFAMAIASIGWIFLTFIDFSAAHEATIFKAGWGIASLYIVLTAFSHFFEIYGLTDRRLILVRPFFLGGTVSVDPDEVKDIRRDTWFGSDNIFVEIKTGIFSSARRGTEGFQIGLGKVEGFVLKSVPNPETAMQSIKSVMLRR